MSDRYVKLLVVLMVGWMMGYFHHYAATKPMMSDLERKTAGLEDKVRNLHATSVPISKVLVKTTAYSTDDQSINVAAWRDGMTATNKVVRKGIVAADWRVFPPGTLLYIPGYGEAVVEDKGGAVKGYHIDLFVDSYEEALKWGVREIEVYVIKKGGPKAT